MVTGKFWFHAECDRAEIADKCAPCRLWAVGEYASALALAAEYEAAEYGDEG